ncbi:ATP-dependent DNA helicase [Corynebacterium glucuronolyticum]|uniref:ATP-dependent helicase DinG n=2 Tax=Corynebacterium glucuronolyticum TaxID=39791 RepID=A0AAX1L6L2_9CORY|nr:ATP-dependent DNA helicase [Corynebacterium glucuronolyticum]EEI62410.1 DEAD/DEAH box helicase [Corynebacterium glucuronolyticum ATCC 51866]QRP70108.1 ATP-dependent DNA helicase [Corynebacterium glucuronolyticum]
MEEIQELLTQAVEAIGGSPRPGQQKMADAVVHAFDSGRHLAVQAGTGTGKSLAYLVPSLHYAHEEDACVIVATATLALQRQLVERDLPRLVEALDGDYTYAILKGRSNYVCLNKLAGETALIGAEDYQWMKPHLDRVYEWADETDTGDRDHLDPGVPQQVWAKVSTTAQECPGASVCPHGDECFAEKAKAQARGVDVVVTNHALLAIDATSPIDILPAHDAVVIDEAHELVDKITDVSTATISVMALKMAATRAEKIVGKHSDGVDKLREVTGDLEEILPALPLGRWEESTPDEAKAPLAGVGDALDAVYTELSLTEDDAEGDPEGYAEKRSLMSHVQTLIDGLERMLEGSDADVVWLEKDLRDERRLMVAPLSVASVLADNLFGTNTTVLTSATLALGGKFDAMARAWGLTDLPWDSLDVGTPFDTQGSAIMYLSRHLPPPGRDGLTDELLDELEHLILAAGGRTLGLFSSKRAAVEATEALRPRLPFDIYCQGDDAIGALIEQFAANENSCLFGTLSLWQGVDVPGPSLSLVTIDRIPFPRPDDPLSQARKEAADARGGNGFMQVAASHAALLMAQGAGRLLRATTDRGVVAILDSRIATKRYGSFILRSIPPMWTTTDLDTVTGALKRLIAARHKG